MGELNINLLGTSFAVKSQEDNEYLQKLYNYYKEIIEIIQRSGKEHEPIKISILAGITLVDELYKAKKQYITCDTELKADGTNNAEAEKLTLEMIKKINSVL